MSTSKIVTVAACTLICLLATSSGQFISIKQFHSPPVSDADSSEIIKVNLLSVQQVSPIKKPLRSAKTLVETSETRIIVIKPLSDNVSPAVKKVEDNFPDTTPKQTSPKGPQKKLKFIFDDDGTDKSSSIRTKGVHLAPEAYPVFYILAKINGKLKGNPIITLSANEHEAR